MESLPNPRTETEARLPDLYRLYVDFQRAYVKQALTIRPAEWMRQAFRRTLRVWSEEKFDRKFAALPASDRDELQHLW